MVNRSGVQLSSSEKCHSEREECLKTTGSPTNTEEKIPTGITKICTVEMVLNFTRKSSHDKMSKWG